MIKKQSKITNTFCNKLGFTLLEILTVLTIIGIISAISIPVYSRIKPSIDLNSSIRQVVSDLREAQQLAVTEQIVYLVEFDTTNNSYRTINTNSGIIYKEVDLSSNINIDSITNLTDDTVSFNATGAATQSGSVVLINNRNVSATIEIKPSGYVSIPR